MEPEQQSPSPSTPSSNTGGTNATTPVDADVAATPLSGPLVDNTTTTTTSTTTTTTTTTSTAMTETQMATTTTTATSASSPSADDGNAASGGTTTNPGEVDVDVDVNAVTASPSKTVESNTPTAPTTTAASSPAVDDASGDVVDLATASASKKVIETDNATKNTASSPSSPAADGAKDTAAGSTPATVRKETRGRKKKKKSAPKDDSQNGRKFFVIRKCESLEAPTIFSSFKDYKFYIDMEDGDNGDENETTRVEYQSFESLDEAISYAFPHQQQQQSSKQQKKDNNNKEAAATVKTLKKELQKSNTREANLQKEIEKMKDFAKQEQERFSSCFEKAAAKAKDRSQKELKREQNAHIKVLEQLKTRHQKALEREQKRSLKAVEKQTKKLKGIIQRQAKKKRSLLELEEEEGNGDETDASNTPLKRPRVEKTSDNRDNQRHLKWKMRYEQLVAYKEQYGDCNVSLREQKKNLNEGNNNNNPESAELKALGVWITTQRTAYTRLKRGEPSSMTRERIELLENIGFIWNAGPGQLPFEKRVEQLIEYRNIHGHCNVPQKHGQLGEFVMHTRKRYREQRMSAEKIAILEEVGFQWSLRNRGGPLELRMAKAAAHAEPFVPDHHDW